jgi:hypothetical protein
MLFDAEQYIAVSSDHEVYKSVDNHEDATCGTAMVKTTPQSLINN